MKIDKLNLDGKKGSIEVLDKIFSAKINKKLLIMFYIKQMLITKEDMLKQNNKMKFQDLHQKFMLKKELVMQDMQVEKHQYLLVVVLLMDQKVNYLIKKEN